MKARADRHATYRELSARAIEIIRSGIDPRKGFQQFLKECAKVLAHPAWESLMRLNVPADLAHHDKWLRSVLESEPPAPEINGLWFGITDPFVDQDGIVVGYELYVSGSSRFDASDPTFEWAASPEYWPNRRYSSSEVFHALGRLAEQHQLPYQLADDVVPLLYAALVVDWLSNRVPRLMLGGAPSRAIAVGHDEGDGLLVGSVDAAGYHRVPQ